MFKQMSIYILVLLTVLSRFTLATPPACVLECVNEQKDVADLATVCGSADVTSCLNSKCSDFKAEALSAFKSVCDGIGSTSSSGLIASSSFTGYPSSVPASAFQTTSIGAVNPSSSVQNASSHATATISHPSASATAKTSAGGNSSSPSSPTGPNTSAPPAATKNAGVQLVLNGAVGAVALVAAGLVF